MRFLKKRPVGRDKDKGSVIQKYDLDEPVLSVIIPAYNLEKEIGHCLKSVLSQGIAGMEVIVVDDCSSDGTVEIVQGIAEKDSRVKLIRQPRNKGVAAARNAALDAAKGVYIHFCDGDDAVPAGAYLELLSIAEEENADMVTGNYSRMYLEEGGVVRPFSHYSAPTGKEQCFESGNTMLWNRIYRRSVIERNHLRFNESLKYYEDFLFFHMFLLEKPSIEATSMSIYIYTEPISRSVGESIRYANLDCAVGLDTAWRTLLSNDIDRNDWDLWFQSYRWNLDWYFKYSWRMIQSPEIRRQAFEKMRDLIRWVEEESQFFSWQSEPFATYFKSVFIADYGTFCSLTYEDYLMTLAIADRIVPRLAVLPDDIVPYMAHEEKDKLLAQGIRNQLLELRDMFAKPMDNKRVWRDLYWKLVDSMVNDYWRAIVDPVLRQELFIAIRETVNAYRINNHACYISNPEILERFKEIFCVDNATLQALNLSQYLLICSQSGSGSHMSSDELTPLPAVASASGFYPSDPIPAFINACANGRVGMRAILRSMKAWLKYKTRRN